MRKLSRFCDRAANLTLIASLALATPLFAWQVEIDTEFGESQDDEAFAIAFDSRGDVIAAGTADYDDWLVVKLGGGSGTELWRTVVSEKTFGTEAADNVIVDANNDVIAMGRLGGNSSSDTELAVIKVRGTTGAEIWRYSMAGSTPSGWDSARDAAVDANGDVIVIGTEDNDISGRDIVVVKLSASDGSELWKRVLNGSEIGGADFGFAVAVDPSNDIVAVGRITNAGTNTDPLIVKLANATGATIWRTEIARAAFEWAEVVVVDNAGDAFVSGRLDDGVSGDFGLIKLAGGDGAVVWEKGMCCGNDRGGVEALALTPSGNVVAAGWAERQEHNAAFNVAEFNGTTGSTEWRILIPGSQGYGTANSVAVDSRGDVLVAGRIETSEEGTTDGILVKIHPCHFDEDNCEEPAPSYDARIAWERRYKGKGGSDDDYDELYSLDLDADGQVAAAGVIWNRNPIYPEESHSDFLVTMLAEDGRRVDGADPFRPACADGIDNDGDGLIDFGADPGCSAADDLFEVTAVDTSVMCSGNKVKVKDRAAKARVRSLSFQSRDPLLMPPPGGSPGDPRIGGAVLEVHNPITGERAYTNLVAGSWEAVGGLSDGSKGYQYRSRAPAEGPCKKVRYSAGKLKAKCKGLGLRFTLDEPSQGTISVRLHLANGERVCTEFGGDIRDDQSTNGVDRTVKFRASKSNPPTSCAP